MFAWEFREEPGPQPCYTALRHGLPAAGIGATQAQGEPSVWTTFFAVDDVDSATTRIVGGGEAVLVGPSDVGDSGRLAVATDPTGPVFGIWQAGSHFGAAVVNEHGGLNWNELITDDIDRATAFYVEVFGFETEVEDWGEGRFYTTFKVGDRGVAGGGAKLEPDIPNHWNIYFAVDSADTAIDNAVANGGSVLREARKTDGVGTIARLSDPSGAGFAIIELDLEID